MTASARLAAIAETDPGRLAYDGPDAAVDYAELDRRVDATAAGLAAAVGDGPHRVVLRLGDTLAYVTTSLALARLGWTSVPVDPGAPPDRARAIVVDVGPGLVVTDVAGDRDGDLGAPTVLPDDLPGDRPAPAPDPDDADRPAAILFTSGSTGAPKGIALPAAQRRLVEQILSDSFPERMRVGVLAVGTVGFSEALLHGCIFTGGTIVPYEILGLGLAPMADWLDDQRIEAMPTVPTVLRFFLPTVAEGRVFAHLRHVVLAAEPTLWPDVTGLRAHLPADAVIHNSYGTTESGFIAIAEVDPDLPTDGPVPIGRPLRGVEVDVVGPDGEPVPPGEEGELVVTGTSVGLGYWRRPELTAGTYAAYSDGRRRCRTGDAGRIRGDGTLEVRGRLDHVVKVKGNRVDLGDVEAALRRVAGVTAAAVTAEPDASGETRLVAHVVAGAGTVRGHADVRLALARLLPPAMIPARTRVVSSLPMLPSGKVDRQALAAVATDEPEADATTMASGRGTGRRAEVEAALVDLYAEVLGRRVGPDDDFFDHGGDSMGAVRLFAEVEATLGISHSVAAILEAPTPASLAAVLTGVDDGVLVPIRPTGELVPLVVVHAGAGGVLFARDLAAAVDRERPVYALRAPALADGAAPAGSLVALAERYLAEVRRVHPVGPYAFAGLSFGALVAFEMALQLEASGQDVDLVVVGDALRPGAHTLADLDGDDTTDGDTVGRPPDRPVRRKLAEARSLGPVAGGGELVRTGARAVARQWRRRRRSWWQRQEVARAQDLLVAYGVLGLEYRPVALLRGAALVVRSTRRHPGRPGHDLGWSAVVAGTPTVLDLDAMHDRLFNHPHATTVGAAVEAALAAAYSTRSA